MPDITAPNAQAYGTYEQALAQMLAGGGQIAGPLNALALNSYARQQRGQYDLALQRTQALQQAEMQRAEEEETRRTYLQQIAPMATAGVSSGVPSAQFGVDTLLPTLQAADNGVVNRNEADALKNRSAAVANMGDVGLLPNAQGTADILFEGNIQDSENEPLLPYRTPDAVNGATRAAASMKSADADMIRAQRPPSSGGGGGGGGALVTVRREIRNADGTVTTVTEKVPAAVAPQAAAPAANSGGRSADETVSEFRARLRANRRE